jgi:hypothetical protein
MPCHATPRRGNDKQRPLVRFSEHASEAAAIGVDRLRYITAFADAHATLVGIVGIPDGAMCIDDLPQGKPKMERITPLAYSFVEGS